MNFISQLLKGTNFMHVKSINYIPTLFLCCVFLNVSSCFSLSQSEREISVDVSSEKFKSFPVNHEINEVLVLPVFKRVSRAPGVSISANELGVPDLKFTNLLIRALEIHTTLSVINPENYGSDGNFDLYGVEIPLIGVSQELLLRIAANVQEKSNAKSVLFTQVDLSDQRTGGKIGSERSSNIKYRIWLYDGSQRRVIWSSAYRSKEQSLTDNLFSFGVKARKGFSFQSYYDLLISAFRGSATKLEASLSDVSSMP
jgi:hypothetical protein